MDYTKEVTMLCQAVDRFAEKMKTKLLAKVANGYTGWDVDTFMSESDDDGDSECLSKLRGCINRLFGGDKGQAVDIANFCMFLDNYYEPRPRRRDE